MALGSQRSARIGEHDIFEVTKFEEVFLHGGMFFSLPLDHTAPVSGIGSIQWTPQLLSTPSGHGISSPYSDSTNSVELVGIEQDFCLQGLGHIVFVAVAMSGNSVNNRADKLRRMVGENLPRLPGTDFRVASPRPRLLPPVARGSRAPDVRLFPELPPLPQPMPERHRQHEHAHRADDETDFGNNGHSRTDTNPAHSGLDSAAHVIYLLFRAATPGSLPGGA